MYCSVTQSRKCEIIYKSNNSGMKWEQHKIVTTNICQVWYRVADTRPDLVITMPVVKRFIIPAV